jgi:uncharacterized protein YndB with AHSA1/START domain
LRKEATVEVTRELIVDAPPEEVWEALTSPERLEEWFANEVELELEPGAEGVFRWEDGEARRALVEEVEVGRRFAFRWREEESQEESYVAFTLVEIDTGTRVVVTETAPGPHACAGEWTFALEWQAAGRSAALVA